MVCRISRSLTVHRKGLIMMSAFAAAVLWAAPAPSASAATSPSAELASTVMGPARFYFSGNITYRITVTNQGPAYAQTVIVSDSWWGGFMTTFYSVSGSAPSGVLCTTPPVGSYGTVTCTTGSLAPGASVAIALTIHVRAVLHNQLLDDTATATSPTFDPNTANNTARAVTEGI
jgi:uncharacterized repeat protein (TIGR01451 family)